MDLKHAPAEFYIDMNLAIVINHASHVRCPIASFKKEKRQGNVGLLRGTETLDSFQSSYNSSKSLSRRYQRL